MGALIAIRREDKNKWERRVPLIPADIAELRQRCGIDFLVQPSGIRVYRDEEYRAAEIPVTEELGGASIILAVKEIPVPLLLPRKVYVFFAHVAKGQAHNMPMLRRIMDLGCTLLDYEKITDDQKRRMIFFGRHAGYAGMIETLRCIGQRLAFLGMPTPLAQVRHAYEYPDLGATKDHFVAIRHEIFRSGLSRSHPQLVIGITGYGNVSTGAQEILDWLHPTEIAVADLPAVAGDPGEESAPLIKLVFREEHMVEPRDAGRPFNLLEYYEHPERYAGCFEKHLPFLDVLVNAIYWEPRYPRLVTRDWARRNYRPGSRPRLQVIGDISCDIEGSIELTVRSTEPDSPAYVYLPHEEETHDGVEGNGPVIMAVDNLPCELPREASQYFSMALREMVPPLAAADWQADFESLHLPAYLKRAVIVHNGGLTTSYSYLEEHLQAHS